MGREGSGAYSGSDQHCLKQPTSTRTGRGLSGGVRTPYPTLPLPEVRVEDNIAWPRRGILLLLLLFLIHSQHFLHASLVFPQRPLRQVTTGPCQ